MRSVGVEFSVSSRPTNYRSREPNATRTRFRFQRAGDRKLDRYEHFSGDNGVSHPSSLSVGSSKKPTSEGRNRGGPLFHPDNGLENHPGPKYCFCWTDCGDLLKTIVEIRTRLRWGLRLPAGGSPFRIQMMNDFVTTRWPAQLPIPPPFRQRQTPASCR